MDPQIRLLHEVTYEAILDSGTRPEDLRGSRTGFFVGLCYADAIKALNENINHAQHSLQNACIRVANSFDFRGPIFQVDTACASSFSCFHEGILHMKAGNCENMVIAGVACHLHPTIVAAFRNIRMLSEDGRSKCLDESVDGYCRSEAVVSLFVQKRSAAKRIYATIIKMNTNCDGFKPEGITYPGYETQIQLMRQTITDSGIDPHDVNYIECHLTGTAAGDPTESNAILNSYRKDCKKPLLFGCLKSNMGHTEGASANCSIVKVAIALQKHCLPPNLNFKNPNPNIEGLFDGRIIPVLKRTPFDEILIPVNSFGFGGVNVHAILKANEKTITKDSYEITDNYSRLVNISGRTEEGVEHTIKWIESNRDQVTKEFLSLLNEISKTPLECGMVCRGYLLIDDKSIIQKKVRRFKQTKSLWFVFSALGSQWNSMAKGMMAFAPFSESITKSAEILKKFNIDLLSLILKDNSSVRRSIIDALVSITCIQIAIVDTLYFVDAKPDGIIGHSIGEVAAGYADGCLTAEEGILTAYYIAKVSKEKQKEGAMAIVGLSFKDVTNLLTDNLFAACDNSIDNVTIAGPTTKIKHFVDEMLAKGLFSKQIQSCGMAYHSPMVADTYQAIKYELDKVITKPKERSERWISTSLLNEHECNKLCDGAYYANNVVSTVYFKQATQKIPRDACVVEIGPHCILLPLIRRTLGNDVLCVKTMKKNDENSGNTFLTALGDTYLAGHNTKIEKLYPKVEYPVPKETASLSHLVKWDHSKDYMVPKFPENFNFLKNYVPLKIDIMDPNYKFLMGHCVDGRTLFPATGYLYIVWERFSTMKGIKSPYQLSVEFFDVSFKRASLVPKNGQIVFSILILEETGEFSVVESGSVCVVGKISILSDKTSQYKLSREDVTQENDLILDSRSIYKELRVRGYDYGVTFQGLIEAYSDGSFGKAKWMDHWISFVDSILHLTILAENIRNLSVPTFIEYIRCDAKHLMQFVSDATKGSNNFVFDVLFDRHTNIVETTGILVKGLKATPIARRQFAQSPTLEYCQFVSYIENFAQTNKLEQETATLEEEKFLHLLSTQFSSRKIRGKKKNEFGSLNKKDMQLIDLLKFSVDVNLDVNEFKKLLVKHKDEILNELIPFKQFETVVKSQIDVVCDNNHSKKINVVEFIECKQNLRDIITDKLRNSFIIQHTLVECVDNAASLHSPISTQKWNINEPFPSNISEVDLIVYEDLRSSFAFEESSGKIKFDMKSNLAFFHRALNSGGFLMLILRDQLTAIEHKLQTLLGISPALVPKSADILKLAEATDFVLISEQRCSNSLTSILLRKPAEDNSYVIVKCETQNYQWIEDLKRELRMQSNKKIWLVANECDKSGIIGMMKCLKKEIGGSRVRCILASENDLKINGCIPPEITRKDLFVNVIREKCLGYYKHFSVPNDELLIEAEHAYLDVKVKGDLSSFQWFQAPHQHWSLLPPSQRNENMILCYIYYSALNFKDVMVATGRIPLNAYPVSYQKGCSIGMEYSAVEEGGNRIFGYCEHQAIATTMLKNKSYLCWKVPENWTLEDAATVPVAYSTAYYALLIRGQLMNGDSVLIHAGSGGVGQAAIAICLARNCKVFVTVGSKEKRKFLKKRFPQLNDSNFTDSRSLRFEEHILAETNGCGVDLILNSLAEEKLRASIDCLKEGGRFLEIGKYDLIQNNSLDTYSLKRNVTFHVICVAHLQYDCVVNKSPSAIAICDKLYRFVEEGIRTGEVVPLPRKVFEKEEAESAFRYMASGKHIGKVLIKIRQDNNNKPEPIIVSAVSQTFFHPLKSFIIIGGLGGLGLELTNWLIERGAKKIVLTSRTAKRSSYQQFMLQKFKRQKALVHIIINDALTHSSTKKLLQEANELGPVGGIFNLAMILKDGLIENQTPESFAEVCAPKVETTINLDSLSRQMCPDLEYFVCFSSAASGRGNTGQSNYGFANSVMERICEKRRDDGLHGLSVQWGAVGDVGFVAESYGSNDVVLGGTAPQRLPSCFEVLDRFMQSPHSVCSSIVFTNSHKSVSSSKGDLLKTISHILGVKECNLDDNASLVNLGMDSLMAVEIKQGLERDYDLVLTTQEIRQLKIKDLKNISCKAFEKESKTDSTQSRSENISFNAPTDLFVLLNDASQGQPVFFLPPIDGKFDLMTCLARFICRPVYGLNWVQEMDEFETIEQAATFFVNKVIANYPQNEYDFVGYSMGAVMALEMAIQLQAKFDSRVVKKLILLDGAPDPVIALSRGLLKKTNARDEETALSDVVIGFISMYVSNGVPISLNELNSIISLNERIERLREMNVSTSQCKDFSAIVESAKRYAKKVKLLCNYNMSAKFKGDVKLIRSNDKYSVSINVETEHDYGLQRITEGNVEVISLPGDHNTFIPNNADAIGNYIENQLYYIAA